MGQLTGQDFYNLVQTKLNGFGMDQTLFYAYLNAARINREMARLWMYLRKRDTSNVVSSGNTYQTPLTIPTDFVRLIRDGRILLFDGNQTWEGAYEIPYPLLIQYKDNNLNFAMDYPNGKFYITGAIDRTYNTYIDYQADFGDITANTTWINIPARFHLILALDVCAMYQLGDDYDDISARNANENGAAAQRLFQSMVDWDDTIQRSSVTTMDYPVIGDTSDFTPHKINMQQ